MRACILLCDIALYWAASATTVNHGELILSNSARPIVLDGAALAARRAPGLAERARDVAQRTAMAPTLLIVAFAENDGSVPHVRRKLSACADAGVTTQALFFPHHATSEHAVESLRAHIAEHASHGVFLQFPFPSQIDGDALAGVVPDGRDVDVMTRARIQRYFANPDELPPVTVSAAHLLLDAHDISVAGLTGVVVAEPSPFAEMFRESMARRGARMHALVSPRDASLQQALASSELVVAAVAAPGAVRADLLRRDAVAIDVGYFNPGARGDIDTAGGADHLRAIVPVPGGIGPMTISALIERVIIFAELAAPA